MREFSPIKLRAGRDVQGTYADWGRYSSRTVFEKERTHTGLHVMKARRGFY